MGKAIVSAKNPTADIALSGRAERLQPSALPVRIAKRTPVKSARSMSKRKR
jgi:hypothetical protein